MPFWEVVLVLVMLQNIKNLMLIGVRKNWLPRAIFYGDGVKMLHLRLDLPQPENPEFGLP
jgi:hypothetical protein